MAEPTYRAAPNGFFYAYWSEGRRSRRKALGTSDPLVARKAFGRWLLDEGKQAGGAAPTIAELWACYWSKHLEPKTVSLDAARYRWKNLAAAFGALKPADVTQDLVDAYERKRLVGKIGRACRPGSVRNELCYLKSCLAWCAHPRRALIAAAPYFEMPAAHAARDRWLQPEQAKQLIGAATGRTQLFIWLALETAARKRAIEELTWDRVDLDLGVIRYDVPGRIVTKKRRATVPISRALRQVLEQADRTGRYVLGSDADVSAPFKRAAVRAGLDWVSPHVLRHTAATLMCRRGVPIATVADVLGNSVAVCMTVYRHHCPGATRAAVEFISGEAA